MAVELAAGLNPPLCYAMLLLVVSTVGCLRRVEGRVGRIPDSDDVVVDNFACFPGIATKSCTLGYVDVECACSWIEPGAHNP